MSPEVEGGLTTLLVLAGAALALIVGRVVLDIGRAARSVTNLCRDIQPLVPRAERILARVEATASHAQAIGEEAREEVSGLLDDLGDLRENGRRVSAWVHGARAGVDALRSSRSGGSR